MPDLTDEACEVLMRGIDSYTNVTGVEQDGAGAFVFALPDGRGTCWFRVQVEDITITENDG